MIRRHLLVALCACLAVTGVGAESEPLPLPTDNRLVVFSFDANQTYPIIALPGTVTDIEFGPDEDLAGAPAIGDSVQWQVAGAGRHLFVKPTKHELFTSMTVVTTKRAYQLTLRSSPAGGKWYQRVSWHYPEVLALRKAEQEVAAAAVKREADRLKSLNAGAAIDPSRLNFRYEIEGTARFRPTTVFDDGRFTWIRMPEGLAEMPALFVPGEAGSAGNALVNYSVRGDFLVVQRTAPQFLLKLGADEVRVTGAGVARRGFLSLFQ